MKKIKLFDITIDSREENVVKKILYSGFWASGSGTGYVTKFEENFSRHVGSKMCIAVNSGTAALHLALSLLDIKGKEVILPALSFVSTAHAVLYNGGIPKFVDVDPLKLNLDVNQIEEKVDDKTRVILPVHFGGMPCDLTNISRICKKNNLMLVEDAAHAVGAKHQGKRIGSHGDLVCFSFHPVKNLAMPTGGAITVNSKKNKIWGTILKSERWCGITNRIDSIYDVDKLGWNYYMNEFSAGIGLEQLKKIDRLNRRRKVIAKRYSQEIFHQEKMPFDKDCCYHLYWILIKNRDKFIKEMKKNGIETGIHYKPINQMKLYKNYNQTPVTRKIGETIVSIPIHANLSDDDVSFIIKCVNRLTL